MIEPAIPGGPSALQAEIERLQDWNRKQAEDIITLGQMVGKLQVEHKAAIISDERVEELLMKEAFLEKLLPRLREEIREECAQLAESISEHFVSHPKEMAEKIAAAIRALEGGETYASISKRLEISVVRARYLCRHPLPAPSSPSLPYALNDEEDAKQLKDLDD